MIFQIIIILSAGILLYVLIKRMPDILKIDFKNVVKIPEINFKLPKFNIKKEDNKIEEKKDTTNKTFSFFKGSETQAELFNQADKCFAQANYSEAEKLYLKIVTLNPKNIKVYNRLGVIYMEKKNFKDAKESFYMAVKLDPSKAARYYNYALACIEIKEFRNAADALENALKLDKNNKKYKNTLKDLKEKVKYRYKEAKRVAD